MSKSKKYSRTVKKHTTKKHASKKHATKKHGGMRKHTAKKHTSKKHTSKKHTSKKHASKKHANKKGGNPSNDLADLIEYSKKGDVEKVNVLLDKIRVDVNGQDKDGMTALMAAASHGERSQNADVMDVLIDEGADVNKQNNQGETALYIASKNGQKLAVEILLSHKVNPDLKTNTGETPLLAAVRNGDDEIVDTLLNEYDTVADVAIPDAQGLTPLEVSKTLEENDKRQKIMDLLSSTA